VLGESEVDVFKVDFTAMSDNSFGPPLYDTAVKSLPQPHRECPVTGDNVYDRVLMGLCELCFLTAFLPNLVQKIASLST
jgi:hypothetical protein